MANGVAPLLYSAAGGLSDGPPPTHPAIQAGMAIGADEDSRVRLLEEWMDRLERQADHHFSEQNTIQVQVETSVSTVSEPAKRCSRCRSKRHQVADCPKRQWCTPGGKPSHKKAHRQQEQEEADLTWQQQWSVLNHSDDWSVDPEDEVREAYYKKYPEARPCSKCKGIGYVVWVELETGDKKCRLCDHKEEPSWGSDENSDSSAAW